MALLRKLLGTGLISTMLSSSPSFGQDTATQPILTHAQVRKQLYDIAQPVNYDTWQQKVLAYKGGSVILFNSSCAVPEADLINMNMERVFIELANEFENNSVANLPIQFLVYDICGKSKADLLNVRTTETLMYFNGREIDRLRGAPTHSSSIPEWTQFLSEQWIPTNLTSPNSQYTWKFQGTSQEKKVLLQQ